MAQPAHTPIPAIPDFEGQSVATTKLKITSTVALDVDGVFRMDDIIRITVEARVSQVHHNVNERSGHLERVHLAKALAVETAPWNPEDPADRGVIDG